MTVNAKILTVLVHALAVRVDGRGWCEELDKGQVVLTGDENDGAGCLDH